ncbi:MAG: GNAT family N-acetyltransferase [Pseudomonadota bacterium]
MTDLVVRRAHQADMAEMARLCWAYRALLVERSADVVPGIVDRYYAKDSYAAMIADLPRIHARPRGDMMLAEHAGKAVGCAMYYPLGPDGVTEIKRVFVDPAARGLGAGRALMADGMRRAAADGYGRMVLDTIAPLTEAITLYKRLGFAPCAPFYEPDPAFAPHLRFFDITLEGTP